jgi:hypothetical protein
MDGVNLFVCGVEISQRWSDVKMKVQLMLGSSRVVSISSYVVRIIINYRVFGV